MVNESEEMIKQQMVGTRAALADKLETLEQQVTGKVHDAKSAVTDTVTTVTDAVQQTVEMAKASVHDTLDAVKDTLDVSRQTRQHPWLMMGGSVSVGFAAGCFLNHAEAGSRASTNGRVPSLSTLAAEPSSTRDGGLGYDKPAPRTSAGPSRSSGFLGELSQKLEKEINMVKELAVGTMLGVARDMIANAAPPQIGPRLAEIIDSATVKLGGQPIAGPILPSSDCDSDRRGTMAETRWTSAAPID